MKKLFIVASLLVFVLGLAGQAIGATSVTPAEQPKEKQHQRGHKQGCGLETVIKDSLQKNNRDLTKVKADVDKFFVQQKTQRDAKLQEMAKQKGVTVDELKAQFKQAREQKLAEKAAKKGVKPEELQQKMQAKHAKKIEKFAKDLGLTVEELKQILPEHPAK